MHNAARTEAGKALHGNTRCSDCGRTRRQAGGPIRRSPFDGVVRCDTCHLDSVDTPDSTAARCDPVLGSYHLTSQRILVDGRTVVRDVRNIHDALGGRAALGYCTIAGSRTLVVCSPDVPAESRTWCPIAK